MSDKKYGVIEVEFIVKETAKARLLNVDADQVWVPKSVTGEYWEDGNEWRFEVEIWWLKKAELYYKEV